ncbi:MAG: thiamine biosynthesis protein ApbE [Sulfurimonas sp. GWF2_37_8]|nr:MAG: thiamine biosynthesis protein ApbE [Sulfurimonas sp. GWF2_37_8]
MRTKVALGTFVSISADERYKKDVETAFGIIEDVEASLSSYRINSPISKLNEDKYAVLDALSYEALLLSQNYYHKTQGYFDITVGSITKDLYRFGADERLASERELQNATVAFHTLFFDKTQAKLQQNAKIDLGGMGKGFAVDKVAAFLKMQKIKDANIAASGDIRCLHKCKIDIQDPFSDGVLLSLETLEPDTAITTSGNYNRYVQNKSNNHLIDPKIKKSQQAFASITLISHLPSSDIDAYATAASVMPPQKAYAFLDTLPLAYIIIETDTEYVESKNLFLYIKKMDDLEKTGVLK